MFRQGLQIMKIEMCDCVKDFRASPTADYDMLANRDLAINIKVFAASKLVQFFLLADHLLEV